jgi:hypothetical protein
LEIGGEVTSYNDFLSGKAVIHSPCGFAVDESVLNTMLFDWQKDLVKWALMRGRAALFEDCGLGKTTQQLEWAKHVHLKTNGTVLILAPLAVSQQTKREGEKFGISVNICKDASDIKPGINITNYERIHNFQEIKLSGIVLDESSILKNFTGKIRNQIIDTFGSVPYKLCCTATPAPNDYTELGNTAEFLGVMSRVEMLAMFFINDTGNTGTWRLKGHVTSNIFWKWLCSWAMMIRMPSDIGYDDGDFVLPELVMHEHIIPYTGPKTGLFVEHANTLSERRDARKESLDDRVSHCAKMINDTGDTWLTWCNMNIESYMLKKGIADAVEVKGSDKKEFKEKSLLDFSDGQIKCLVTKPKIAGFGLNFQTCSNMAFVGLSDSYEQFYQAVRRCWRFGQKNTVHAHIITGEREGATLENIKRKGKDMDDMYNGTITNMKDLMKSNLKQSQRQQTSYEPASDTESPDFITMEKSKVINQDIGDNYAIYNADSCELTKSIPSNSTHYQIFSPPFASLFTYSDSDRDMGNCKHDDVFMNHFKFLVPELYRILMPGRLVSFHCMDLPATLTNDGFMGLKDLPGLLVKIFQDAGFIYHSKVVIWKDPLVQAVRTKQLSLAHKQISKDSSRCAQGLPDYVVTMRKPGENTEPVSHGRGFESYIGDDPEPVSPKTNNPRGNKYSHEVWRRYASPVWFDINQTNTLNIKLARDKEDERHICRLQLDTIGRCLEHLRDMSH